MARETLFLTLEELLELHRQLIERFGGAEGVGDPGLLESALARPRSGYYASLSEQAAALMQSLAGNHAFVDGNERVAFAATAVFLRMNGYRLAVGADEAERFLVDEVIGARADVSVIARWLERFLSGIDPHPKTYVTRNVQRTTTRGAVRPVRQQSIGSDGSGHRRHPAGVRRGRDLTAGWAGITLIESR